MRAKLIHNPSLSVSAEGVFFEVKENLKRYKKHIIIVPERQTLISEKQLLKALNKKCSFECEVISINRLCNRVFGIGEVLDKQGGTMLVEKILQDKERELVFFKSMQSKLGFAENLFQTIMQFKSSGVKPKDIEVKEEKTLFNLKMQDIKLVYEEYEKYIQLGYTDGAFKLEKLRSEIKTNPFFEGTAFYFAYFESFTYHEIQIINDLIEHHNFCVIGCRYALGTRNEHIFTNSIYSQMQGMFFEKGLNEIVEYNVVLPSVFEGLKENLFAYSPKPQFNYLNKVRLFCAKSPSEEVASVLKQVYFLVKKKGFRYKDINIAVGGLEAYKPIFEKELSNYSFSVYFDSSISLIDTELGKFITTMLECVHYGFMSTDIFVLINNKYFGLDSNQINLMNLFLKRYSFQGLKRLIDFNFIEKDEKFINLANEIGVEFKEVLIIAYDKLSKIQNLLSGTKSGTDYVKNLREVLAYFDIEKVTEDIILSQNNDLFGIKTNEQVLGKVNRLLDQILELDINNQYTSLAFSQILRSGLDSSKINLVPLSVDAIFIGDATESTFEKKKVMIIVGATYGKIPQIKDDVGLILDREIDELSSKFILEPKVSEINMRSRLKVYELCLLSNDLLFVYYPETSESSENQKPSLLFTSLTKCFYYEENKPLFISSCDFDLRNIEEDDEDGFLESIGSIKVAERCINENIEQINDIRFASMMQAIQSKQNRKINVFNANIQYEKPLIKNLGAYCFKDANNGNGKQTSFTQISEYLSCPFKHFVKRALKIQEIEKVGINQLDIGNILHAYAQFFVNKIKQNKGVVFESDELAQVIEFVENKVQKEFENVYSMEENSIILRGIRKEGEKLIKQLNFEYSKTNFKPYACELYFNDFKVCASQYDYYLSGSIDRVDKFENYYSIIDYKTGSATLEIKDIYYGSKLQLPLYSIVLNSKIENSVVVGFGYYPIKDKFIDISKDENVTFKIDGYYVKNEIFIDNLDFDLKDINVGEKKQSKTYSFSKGISKEGVMKYDGAILELEDFNFLVKYAREVIQKAIKEIELGYIEPKPVKDGLKHSCEFCEYSSICNKELFAKEREFKSIKIQSIKEAISGISTDKETE